MELKGTAHKLGLMMASNAAAERWSTSTVQ